MATLSFTKYNIVETQYVIIITSQTVHLQSVVHITFLNQLHKIDTVNLQ